MKIKPLKRPGSIDIVLEACDDKILAKGAAADQRPLFRLQKILVPLDFSPCSLKAVRYAMPLATQYGSEITFLHVLPLAYGSEEFSMVNYPFPEEDARSHCEKKLSMLAEQEGAGTLDVKAMVRMGRPVREIVAVAKEIEADLIIIATHGYGGLKHALLGSTTELVTRHAGCPVLVVREEEHEFITD